MAIKIPIISEYDKRGQDAAETGLGKLGKSAKKLAKIGAAAFAAVGAGALVMGKQLLDAGERAATSNARILQITESMGQFEGATQQVTDRLVGLAEKTARLTGVDQNLIKEGQALLLTFKSVSADADKVGGVFDRATKASIDLAAAGFGSVTSNAVQLGKALEDPIKGLAALGKSGVTFTDEQKALIKTLVETGDVASAQEIILKAVESQVGGTAEATANASDKMKVAWSLLQENLGERLLPVFEKFTKFIIDTLIPHMEDLYTRVAPYVTEAFNKVATWLTQTGIPAFKAFADYVKINIIPTVETITKRLIELGSTIMDIVGPTLKTVLVNAFKAVAFAAPIILKVLDTILAALNGIADAAETAINWLGKINPMKAVGSIGGFIGGLVPGMAEGGIVTSPTLAMIGEGGQPEAVIPLDKLGRMGGGNTTININGGLASSADIGVAVVNAIRAFNRQNGPANIAVA